MAAQPHPALISYDDQDNMNWCCSFHRNNAKLMLVDTRVCVGCKDLRWCEYANHKCCLCLKRPVSCRQCRRNVEFKLLFDRVAALEKEVAIQKDLLEMPEFMRTMQYLISQRESKDVFSVEK